MYTWIHVYICIPMHAHYRRATRAGVYVCLYRNMNMNIHKYIYKQKHEYEYS